MAQLVERANASPDELSYASAGIGTTPHLAGELLKIAAGINIMHVPYPGAGPAMQSILSGTVPLMCASLPGAHPSILAGTMRALAVTGTQRWYDMPDVPTMLELGYAGFVSDTFHAMLAQAGTPPEIVDRLATVSLEALKQPEFHERLRTLGFEVIGNGPDGLRRRIADEQRPIVEPTRVGAEHDGRQCLDDPDPAQELELNGILGRHEDDEDKRAELDDQRHPFRHLGFLLVGRIPVDEFPMDVARVEIGGGDRHDRCRHQGADADPRESDADEPGREAGQQQPPDREIVA